MPTYTFREQTSGNLVKRRLSFADYDNFTSGSMELLGSDGKALEYVLDPGKTSFVMRDGSSGGWPSKALLEKKYRAARSSKMAAFEKDNTFKPKLIPNYKGAEAPTWKEAQDEARFQEGTSVAESYSHHVEKEASVS
jgi:hypothetical protein